MPQRASRSVRCVRRITTSAGEITMFDVAMLVMTGGFFAVGALYVLACERL
jgi:hypothetical protein